MIARRNASNEDKGHAKTRKAALVWSDEGVLCATVAAAKDRQAMDNWKDGRADVSPMV